MKNRLIKLFLIIIAVTFVFTLVAQTAFADTADTDGSDNIEQKPKTEYFKNQVNAYKEKNINSGLIVSYINCQTNFGGVYRGYSIVSIDGQTIDLSRDMLLWLSANFKSALIEDNALFLCNYYPSMTDLYLENGYSGFDKPEPSDMKEEKQGLKIKYTSSLDPASFFKNDLAVELINELNQKYHLPIYKSYIYATKFNDKRLTSSAEYKYDNETVKLYIHEFNAEKVEAEIYQTVPNTKLINYGVIAAGLLFVVGFFVAFIIMEKKK